MITESGRFYILSRPRSSRRLVWYRWNMRIFVGGEGNGWRNGVSNALFGNVLADDALSPFLGPRGQRSCCRSGVDPGIYSAGRNCVAGAELKSLIGSGP